MTAPAADRDASERVSYHHRDDGPWPYTAVLTTDQPDQPPPARLWDAVERLEIHDTRTQGLLDTIRHLEAMLKLAHDDRRLAVRNTKFWREQYLNVVGKWLL